MRFSTITYPVRLSGQVQGSAFEFCEMLEEDRHERCNIVCSFHRSTLECHEPRIKGALEPMSDDLRRTRHTRRKKIRRSQAGRRRTRSHSCSTRAQTALWYLVLSHGMVLHAERN